MTENHKVEEAEIITCPVCGKLTLHEIVRNNKNEVLRIDCTQCETVK